MHPALTLHHVIVRSIERRRIVNDIADRKNFVNRLGELAGGTKTVIYAWALMTNHAHILLRSAEIGLAGFMRSLLTGYAISYNRRHRRWGYLFQNRYKSIEELKGGSRHQAASRARALIAIGLVKEQGLALAEVARRLQVSTSAISKIIKRTNRQVKLVNTVPYFRSHFLNRLPATI